jgi:hypothetical protein
LRAAEEAKRLAMHGAGHQPLVINNNASASAAASASSGGYRQSLLRQFVQFLVVTGLLFLGGFILVGTSAGPQTAAGGWGLGLVALSGLMFLVGMPVFALRGVWRLLFG